MEIEFRIFANLRDILGFKEKSYNISLPITIQEFLKMIKNKEGNGEQFYSEIIDKKTQNIKSYVKIILDGQILFTEETLNTQITKKNQVIAVFPPVGGG